jgi:DNA invertase Pin-like site-specific DNA recombinase
MAVALYARVSTSKQAEKDLSIPDQLRQMREWCKQQGYPIAAEYVEPGASATDDRRPIFQQMIADACFSPSPFEGLVVHSLSRFFRDSLQLGLYELKLKKAGVRLFSISQQTGDDPAGEMARKIFSVFDEYQSKENGKHTLRAMQENARQGFFNGSTPPLGYRTVEQVAQGNKGHKKRLELDPAEARIVKQVFGLYLNGHNGHALGLHGLVAHLNQQGMTVRGKPWTRSRLHELLTSRTAIGEYYFNMRSAKTRKLKPRSEWIVVKVESIINEATFNRVQQLRHARSPVNVPPRVVNCPTLLTGLLKCAQCGAGMTLATGKGGRYRYYKCTSRMNKGSSSCPSGNLPMEKVDRLVLGALADRVFVPSRVQAMLDMIRKRLKRSRPQHAEVLKALKKELETLQQRTDKLYEAVEKGLLPMDASLTERAHKLQVRRQEILLEIGSLTRQQELPAATIGPRRVHSFCEALRTKLMDRTSGFGKRYLKLLVTEISVKGKSLVLKGSHEALARAVGGFGTGQLAQVPSFGLGWLPELYALRTLRFEVPRANTA